MAWLMMMTPSARAIDGIPNMRSFDGISCQGHIIRKGLVYRSASPANASSEACIMLRAALKLRSIIDLRAPEEGNKDVGPRNLQADHAMFPVRDMPRDIGAGVTQHPRATYHINLLDKDVLRQGVRSIVLRRPRLLTSLVPLCTLEFLSKRLPSRRLRCRVRKARNVKLAGLLPSFGLDSLYNVILEFRKAEIRSVLMLCSKRSVMPLLLHCTHGKDRTGVVSALLLHICGASRDDILADYSLSNEWGCSPDSKWTMRKSLPLDLAGVVDLDPWCEARAYSMDLALDAIELRYGSLDAYLDSIGLAFQDRKAIREVMLIETNPM